MWTVGAVTEMSRMLVCICGEAAEADARDGGLLLVALYRVTSQIP